MITEIRNKFNITDEEALYIKQVTEEKAADPVIRTTVTAHREDRIFLEGAYRGQVNGEIQEAYHQRATATTNWPIPITPRRRHLRHHGHHRH